MDLPSFYNTYKITNTLIRFPPNNNDIMYQAWNALRQRQTAQEEISRDEEIAVARQRTSTALVALRRQETRTTPNYFASFAHGADEHKLGEENEAMDEETTEEVHQQPPQPPHQPNQQQQN
eukprot:1001399-Ditylum_brightwellii.AAC.1